MRISIVGTSGSGKSTLGARLGQILGVPFIELDAINWQPGWTDLNTHRKDEFNARVADKIAADGWIMDGNYGAVREAILARATDVIWLDYERPVIMRRVIARSFKRAWDQTELWAGTGNTETFARWLDKEHPIRWAWDTWAMRRARYEALFAEPRFAHLNLHRLKAPREADALVARIRAGVE